MAKTQKPVEVEEPKAEEPSPVPTPDSTTASTPASTPEEPKAEEPKVEEPKESKGDINCFQGGVFIRAYNAKVHGKNALKLAEGFVSKRADREIK